MEILKEVLATICYILGAFYLSSITFDTFNWFEFVGGLTCLVLAYFTWPSKKRAQRESENILLDILEFLIELPFEILGWLFKSIGRTLRNKDSDIDLDIDF